MGLKIDVLLNCSEIAQREEHESLKAKRESFKMCIMYFDEENQRIADLITCRTLKSNYRSPSSGAEGQKLILALKCNRIKAHFAEVSSELRGAMVVSAFCSIYFVGKILPEHRTSFGNH